ncbi:hypothetical protein QN360_08625 [Glaciimonas sp. CA11.2]|uniref:hypothetical protein n=1 Tax=unclassified Glaciimonas TaxID=2644401 RepID=UPI002AB53556|nr:MULTISPECIES: hypothetical protein [unclassified Glaciimonas]MDY7546516.1 hypothetical protein [Glaciimonas sp. CA11.2]MEB0012907.1 hypothetical protein [Glaciimonas sp. Cout2]MEB0080802.1 hypothetical protein [Glaciimonas sp. Gout2]MEB0162972.1 hypothetical protein [Glaciimonas sp. CA11.2]
MTEPSRTPPSASATESFHTSFSWLLPQLKGDEHAQFYALTVDICQGVKTCIDLAHLSNTDRDDGTMPTLNNLDTETLLRLALSSSQLLAEMAARRIDRMNDRISTNAV